MASAWQIHFDPTTAFLIPRAKGNPTVAPATPAGTRPPAGSFPVVVSVKPRITDDAKGAAPLASGATQPAVLELIGRLKPAAKSTATFVSIGTIRGTVDFNTSGAKPLPRFTCGTVSVAVPGSTVKNVRLDFTESTAAEIVPSDWVMRVLPDPDTFVLSVGSSFQIRLPWQFADPPPPIQLTARLTIGGTVACDETRNTPLDIPLTHTKVDEDLTGTTQLSFFGVRTVVPNSLVRPKLALGSHRVLVYIDQSLATFVTSNSSAAALTTMRTDITTCLTEVGFPTVTVVMPGDPTFAAEQTTFNSFFGQTGGKFHSTHLTNLTTIPPNAPPGAKPFLPDRDFVFNGDGSTVPFFEFYICLENSDPPSANELGEGEQFAPSGVNVTAATKLVSTPILLFAGASKTSGIRKTLASVDPADHGHLMANIVCHEVGHSLGLRHGLTCDATTPYIDNDSLNSQNSLMYITSVLQPPQGTGSARCRRNQYGPVQRLALRANYTIP